MMLLPDQSKTICAVATPGGIGAIAMVRLSGPDALKISTSFLSKDADKIASNTATFALIKDRDRTVDEVMIIVYREPKSYTGENMVEIMCHASPYIQSEILRLCMESGAFLAQPGEFSMRAYLNKKMDLSQAEAVADVIASESASSHKIAMSQLRGGYSIILNDLRQELINFSSLIELELDFAEEDVEFANRPQLLELIQRIQTLIHELAQSFQLGNALKKGIPIAIVGPPNAGKSTLLNALLNEERAIVSEIAGTTRDTVEDHLVLDGMLFRLIDTAGIRQTTDQIESIGIQRSYSRMDEAHVIVCVLDATESFSELERTLNFILGEVKTEGKIVFLAFNKIDLMEAPLKSSLPNHFKEYRILELSAKHKTGIDQLIQSIAKDVRESLPQEGSVIVSNARHHEALVLTSDSLNRAHQGLQNGLSGDLVALDIRQAIHHLGSITGEITTDDLLENIFSKFCIGK
jgi:tRNA modification GTPase